MVGRHTEGSNCIFRLIPLTLEVGREAVAGGRIDWAALLPDDELTGWLVPDSQAKTLRFRLSTSCG